ncbi:MAG TPA: FAD/NAD(P)-binding oxidoreductase [Candidatus Bathyarchaeia archaeon]|nr:FAD/NAD(P)-binding oxidoreductase [Candidatus Bathyarchaeia archaeon]
MTSNILVLGCGLGGLNAASIISKQVGNSGTVTIVEPRARIPFPPTFPLITFGWRKPEKIQKSLKTLARRKNIRIVEERAEKIDIHNRVVTTPSQELSYDKLIIALGAELASDAIPGLETYGHNFYSLDGAVKLRDAVEKFHGGKIAIGVCRTPYKCPAAPYEITLLMEEHARKSKMDVEIQLFTPEPYPVPAAGSVIGKQVARLLASRGVKYMPKTKLIRVEKDKLLFEDGSGMNYDLFIGIPPHRPPKIVVDAGLAEPSGWISVNPYTLATRHEDVYAVGDVASIDTPHGHMPFLPKAGVFAQGQAETVANNIAVSVCGKGQMKQWDGRGACHLQVSKSEAAFLQGSFLSNPPKLEFYPPSRKWYLDKVKREKNWLA